MQTILVFAIVGGAAAYLFFTMCASLRGKGGCGSCSNAAKKTAQNGAAPLVQITMNGRALPPLTSTRREK